MKALQPLLLLLLSAACTPWPPEAAALDTVAADLTAPPLLPQAFLVAPQGGVPDAAAAGDALAAGAAALQGDRAAP